MNQKSRSIMKCITAFVLTLAMTLGTVQVPFVPGSTLVHAADPFCWDGQDGKARVETGLGNETDTYGYWYVKDDYADGGKSKVIFDKADPTDNSSIVTDDDVFMCKGVSGTVVLDKGTYTDKPYVYICFDIVGATSDENPEPLSDDASGWGGLTISYECDCDLSLELSMGENGDASIGNARPYATLYKAIDTGIVKDIAWSGFKQPSWGKVKVSGEEVAQKLVTVMFKIQARAGIYHFRIAGIGSYGASLSLPVDPNVVYNITYNLNGGTNAESNPSQYSPNTETFTLADPEREGYRFKGWFKDAELTIPATTTIPKHSAGNKIFYAKWEADVKFTTHALLLSSEIGVQFRVNFPDDFVADGCYVDFVSSDGRSATVLYSEAQTIENSNDRFFSFNINALELADTITATLNYGDGSTEVNEYSAMEYIEEILSSNTNESESLYNLVDALQAYGYYMQQSGWTDDAESHNPIPIPKNTLNDNDILSASEEISSFQYVNIQDLKNYLNNIKINLTLNSNTTINVLVSLKEGFSMVSNNFITRDLSGVTYYQFTSDQIGPRDLGQEKGFNILIKDSDNNEINLEISVPALAYVNTLFQSNTMTKDQKAAMTAYYKYYLAACAI